MATKVGSMFASLTVDTQQFVRGMGQADKLTGTTMESIRRSGAGAARSLDGVVRAFGSTGLASGARVFREMEQSAGALPVTIRGVSTAVAALGSVLSGSVLTRGLDTFTGIQNQLRSVGDGFGSTGAQFQALLGVADRSRSSIESVVTLFSRLAKAQPGAQFEKTARSVETISKALQLGGATAEEAASAAVQFSQAIASNRLGGDELRAVLESPLGNALAKGLGVTIGKLRELSTQGKLTSDVVLGALEKIGPEIDQKFGQSVQTIGQSFTVLQNQVVAAIGKIDERFGASRLITGGITTVADNLDLVTKAAEAAAVALAAVSAGRIGGGGAAALGASLRAIGDEAEAGVAKATSQLGVLENAFQKALRERARLNNFQGPQNARGLEQFNQAVALSNKRIAEISTILPVARAELAGAQKAATGFGLAMSGIRGAAGGLVSFLGGPWGVAFAAAAAGVSLLAAKQAEAAQQARDYEELSKRLLNKAAPADSAAADTIAKNRRDADLKALQGDVDTAKAKLTSLLTPLNAIGSQIDQLRKESGEFLEFPGAVRAVQFLDEQVKKLVAGGSIKEFNAALDAFQRRYTTVPVTQSLFEEARGQVELTTEAVKILSLAQDDYNKKLGESARLAAIPTPEAAVDAASSQISTAQKGRASAESLLFAIKVDSIKAREVQIADSLAESMRKAGITINAGLQNFINQLARTKALTDDITVESIAAQKPFEIRQNKNIVYPPGKGPNGQLERGNQAILLGQLLAMENERSGLRDKLGAEQQTIGNTGGLLKNLFGTRADSPEIKGALSGIEQDVKKVFNQFNTGKIDAQEAFKQISAIRDKLVQLGAEPAPLTAFMAQINSAITGIPNLGAQIDVLTAKMRALAAAANSVRMPDGSKIVRPPSSASSSRSNGGGGPPRFAEGGMFKVGGIGGTDSQHVQFMASPTEHVAVFTPSQLRALNDNGVPGGGSGGISVHAPVTIVANDLASFTKAKRQVQMDMADAMHAAINRTR